MQITTPRDTGLEYPVRLERKADERAEFIDNLIDDYESGENDDWAYNGDAADELRRVGILIAKGEYDEAACLVSELMRASAEYEANKRY